MKNGNNYFSMSLLLTFLIISGTTCTVSGAEEEAFGPGNASGELLWKLISASDAIYTNLTRIEMGLTDAGLALSNIGLEGLEARAVLSKLTATDPSVIDCITIDTEGTVREVEPESFQDVKGVNLKDQEHVNATINTRLYQGFHFIRAVEGMYALDAEMPVFDGNGTFVGTVSFLFNSSQFFGRVLAPFQPGRDSKLWVCMADDATILYETDPSQIMLNRSSPIFQDYQSILQLMEIVISKRTGYGTYQFLDQIHQKTIEKGCYWTTIPNRGAEMRLVLTVSDQISRETY